MSSNNIEIQSNSELVAAAVENSAIGLDLVANAASRMTSGGNNNDSTAPASAAASVTASTSTISSKSTSDDDKIEIVDPPSASIIDNYTIIDVETTTEPINPVGKYKNLAKYTGKKSRIKCIGSALPGDIPIGAIRAFTQKYSIKGRAKVRKKEELLDLIAELRDTYEARVAKGETPCPVVSRVRYIWLINKTNPSVNDANNTMENITNSG